MPPIAEKVLAFDNLGPKYRVIVRIGLRSPGPQRLQDRARGGNCGLTKQLACSGWEHGVIVLTGDPL